MIKVWKLLLIPVSALAFVGAVAGCHDDSPSDEPTVTPTSVFTSYVPDPDEPPVMVSPSTSVSVSVSPSPSVSVSVKDVPDEDPGGVLPEDNRPPH